jgi:hypothetical protein
MNKGVQKEKDKMKGVGICDPRGDRTRHPAPHCSPEIQLYKGTRHSITLDICLI